MLSKKRGGGLTYKGRGQPVAVRFGFAVLGRIYQTLSSQDVISTLDENLQARTAPALSVHCPGARDRQTEIIPVSSVEVEDIADVDKDRAVIRLRHVSPVKEKDAAI